jgi:CRP-like cAMP-binding protein
MTDISSETNLLRQVMFTATDMDAGVFDLSLPHWQLRHYKKGEFYNEYKNVCKHLGFIINGVFRIYRVNDQTGEEKNMLFFTDRQFFTSFTSFLTQTECNYYTEAMSDALILYIHVDQLNTLYKKSHQWERFGRLIAETAYHSVMRNTEGFLFKSPEDRYLDMLEKHPHIFNSVPLYHIASYLGIQGPSLSRIRKRIVHK